ncbi:menaquinone biosynthetic enzyme MqnA/MqnD family protein [Paenibacillus sp. CAU 1782]
MGLKRPIIIGEIDYANAWPLFHGLENNEENGLYRLVSAVPSKLNGMLSDGALDVSAISSFSYGKHASQYILLPGLSVGTVGRVHSILLFLKQPIGKVKPKTIAVTTTSATSVNLLKIIMAKRFQCNPAYIPAEPDLGEMLKTADAALLIGDPAIAASWQNHPYEVMDLGQMWQEWTGLGMTYAVVAARKDAVEQNPEGIAAVYDLLKACRVRNCASPEPLVDEACTRLGGTREYWRMYFETLQYDFCPRLQEGLELYFRLAGEMGLLPRDIKLSFLELQSPLKVKE